MIAITSKIALYAKKLTKLNKNAAIYKKESHPLQLRYFLFKIDQTSPSIKPENLILSAKPYLKNREIAKKSNNVMHHRQKIITSFTTFRQFTFAAAKRVGYFL